MTPSADPERELVRRAVPWMAPAVLVALAAGRVLSGWDAAWSAALGVVVVSVNFVVSGLMTARAARVSPTFLFGAVLIGFAVRMAVIVAVMFGLNQLAFFSPLAFGLAVVPALIALLAFEMKLLGDGVGSELRLDGLQRIGDER